MSKFAPSTINALVEVISGGSGNRTTPPIGLYRSGPEIERFMMHANLMLRIGNGSRVPALTELLIEQMKDHDGDDRLARLIELVADPRDYVQNPDRAQAVTDYLNRFLIHDGLELVTTNGLPKLRTRGSVSLVVDAFATKTVALNFDAVRREVDRALESAERDPPVAVTAACVIIESVCRSILAELKIEAPAKRDVETLLRAVQEPLGLSPARTDLPELIAADVRQVLGGLTSTAKGIGALRTHGGSAHATLHGQAPIDARIARFAIHSASTIALFLVETWERKHHTTLKRVASAEASA